MKPRKSPSFPLPGDETYTFHARNTDVPFVVAELAFSPEAYGAFDYRVIYHGTEFSCYLSEKGLRETRALGKTLTDPRAYLALKNRMNALLRSFQATDKMYADGKIKKDVKALLRNLDAIARFSQLYRYCEQPMLAYFEDLILEETAGKTDINALLHDPNSREARSLTLSKEALHALLVLRELGQAKFNIHKDSAIIFNLLGDLFSLLEERHGLTPAQLNAASHAEIEALVKGRPIDIATLNERMRGCALIPGKATGKTRREFICITGKGYEQWRDALELPHGKIQGRPAYPGKARGKVRIMLSMFKAGPLPPGCILVSGMTNPQMVPFMKRVAAIVTDEGGLTCHAAIVAREMRIPCIVGTGNATRVLKDGDMVEVDAEMGIVKIIKRAS